MMYKRISAVLINTLVIILTSFAIDYNPIEMRLIADSKAWEYPVNSMKSDKYITIIPSDTVVSVLEGQWGNFVDENTEKEKRIFVAIISYDGEEYTIEGEALLPINNTVFFPSTWLSDPPGDTAKIWVMDYYLTIMKNKNRDLLLTYEKGFIKEEGYHTEEKWVRWYETYSPCQNLVIQQTAIWIGNVSALCYWILKIEAYGQGFKITVTPDAYTIDRFKKHSISTQYNLAFPHPDERLVFDIILIPDGEYMDAYVDTTDNRLASFAKAEYSFLKKFKTNVMGRNPNTWIPISSWDISGITFPRRADKNHSVGTSCIVAENLRLRKEESTSSATLHTMKAGTQLTILQLGTQQTIDDITANWVQVQRADGTTGWCFGGYLLEQ